MGSNPDFVTYLRENWFGRMETVVGRALSSERHLAEAKIDVPSTSSHIESYHGHLKKGHVGKKCAAHTHAALRCV